MTTHLTRAADEITRLLREFDEHEDSRGWKKNQPRDPGGEGGGQWVKGAASAANAALSAARKVLNDAEIERDYGVAVKSYTFSKPRQVVARKGGTLTIQAAKGSGKHQVFAAVGADDARSWADMVESTASQNPAAAVKPKLFGRPVALKTGANGLVEGWDLANGLLVGHDERGEVVIRFTGDADADKLKQSIDEYDGFDLGDYQADEFAQALREMADAATK